MEYLEFHVKIDADGVHVPREGALSPIDGKIAYGDDSLRLRQRTLDMFKRWLESKQFLSPARDDLAVVGAYLYAVLFSDKRVHEAFCKAITSVNKRNSEEGEEKVALRLVLEFADDSQSVRLAALPWEYLYFPSAAEGGFGKGFFIAGQSPLILSRHVPRNPAIAMGHREDELRILVLVSQPSYEMVDSGKDKKQARPLDKIESAEVIQVLEGLKTKFPATVRLSIEGDDVSKENLGKLVKSFRPHVVHFIGHGRFDGATGALAFVRRGQSMEAIEQHAKGREAAWVDDASFADYFLNSPPRLVFLQACEGARSDSYQAFSGVAMTLVQQTVRAVIAMRYPVSNDVAKTFATTFYSYLAEGCDIDQAVQLGRERLGTGTDEEKNFSNPDFGSPVAFFQGRDDKKGGDGSTGGDAILTSHIAPPPEPPLQAAVFCPYPDCHKPLNPGRSFCAICKRPVGICPACRAVIATLNNFCDACGWMPEGGAPSATTAAAPAPRPKD